jgi:pimeloyl-ACP methyl ester carboxylesterase
VSEITTEKRLVKVADGRSVEVLAAPASAGLPLLFHTGTPAGLVEDQVLLKAAAANGLRCVQYARPGYSNSSPQPGRRVGDAVADVTAILGQLEIGDFVTAGWSGGGPHALACAALLPGRCLATATLAGVAPYSADGLDWLAGMAQENIDEFGRAVAGEAVLAQYLNVAAPGLAEVTADELAEVFGDLVTAPDKAVLHGEFGAYLAESSRAAVSTGIAGWRDDNLAFVHEWGFDVADIGSPVTVWQGDQDAMVPLSHGQWLASHVPGAKSHLRLGEGHLSLVVKHLDDILGELAAETD